ncbi:HAD-IIB family hydrolase [Gordonia bronchialis]|uniref:HAD-IIB family hydrolase n=1 Tax=Gordonia bronchialis TaxID=2054 RepID=UPI00226EB945|nr:HAD-IIB family hydrolase [Gordonia bronchialis]
MKVPKCIVLDIDGTLINDSKQIQRFTRNELHRVVDDFGVQVSLVSARMPSSIRRVIRQLGIDASYSAYSGCFICTGGKERWLGSLPASLVKRTVEAAWLKDRLHIGVFSLDSWYVREVDYWSLREARGTGVWPQISALSEITSSVVAGSPIHKVMFRGQPSDLRSLIESEQLIGNPEVTLQLSETALELYPADVSKLNSVRALASESGNSLDDVMAFGDSDSDAEMIARSGVGVAMSNASDLAKSEAAEITLSNNEDGVGLMIRKYFPSSSRYVDVE